MSLVWTHQTFLLFPQIIHSLAFLFFSPIQIIAHANFTYNNCMPTIAIVLCKYVLAIALVRINFVYLYYLSLCKLVAKVNYNMFQSQPFRMWRSHAAATKNNDGRNYTCIRKTRTNQSCGVSWRHNSFSSVQFSVHLNFSKVQQFRTTRGCGWQSTHPPT